MGASSRCTTTYPRSSRSSGTHTTRWARKATTTRRRPAASAKATATNPSTTGSRTARSWNSRPATVATTTIGPDHRLPSCSRWSSAQVATSMKMETGQVLDGHHPPLGRPQRQGTEQVDRQDREPPPGTRQQSAEHEPGEERRDKLQGHDLDHGDPPVQGGEVGVQPGDEQTPGKQVSGVVLHQQVDRQGSRTQGEHQGSRPA